MRNGLGTCSGWKASYTKSPGGLGTLHVTGRCKFPTAGFFVYLQPKQPQGINPKILLLVRHVHSPTGRAKKVETIVQVRYAERTGSLYELVHILPDGIEVGVEVTD